MATLIRAEMTANIWKVLVAEGETVEAGDTVFILESMKMEIPVQTDAAGRIRSIDVEPGDVVQEGQLLASVD